MYQFKPKYNLPLCFWVILICLSGHIDAQDLSASEYDIKWVQLPDLNANRNIYDVFQDRYGVLWIGSKSGLYRYDGLHTERHSFFHNDTAFNQGVRSVKEDSEGNLWVGTGKGLKILDPTRSYLLPLSLFNVPDSLADLPTGVSTGPGNSLYIAAGKQVFQYEARHFVLKWTLPVEGAFDPFVVQYSRRDTCLFIHDLPSNYNSLFVIDPGGRIIKNPRFYDKQFRLLSNKMFNGFISFCVSADSVQLCQSNIACRYDKSHQYFISELEYPIQKYVHDRQILIDLLVQKSSHVVKGNLPGFAFADLYRLPNGVDVWLSTEGFFMLQPKKINFRQVEASIGRRIRGIQTDGYGRLIYGTYPDLLWQFRDEKKPHVLIKNWLSWAIQPIDIGRTGFLLGQGEGLNNWLYAYSVVNGISLRKEKYDTSSGFTDPGTSIYCSALDTARNGIWHYQRVLHGEDHFQLMFYDVNKQRHYFLNLIPQFAEPRCMTAGKDLWIGSPHGLSRFLHPDPRSGQLTEDNSAIPAAIRNLSILCMYGGADGAIWFGADGKGLYRYTPETGQYEQFTSAEGLADNSVFTIIGAPGDSVLWIGTGKGLSRLEVRQRRFENYFEEDGLAGNEFNTAAAYRAPDGVIYMGGQNGITFFHPDNFKSQPPPLRQNAYLSLMGAGGNDDARTYILRDGDRQEVSPDIQLVQITFHTDDYLHAEQQQFRYRIPGVIDHWQTLSYNDKALLPYLPSGVHIIEVQTLTHRGIWLAPVRYTLDVRPPWYRTWWFYTIAVLIICGVLYSIYLLRIRQLRREFELRQQISHDLHDSLGSRIYLLRALGNQIANPLTAGDKKSQREKFEEISRETLKSIRDFIWAFDPMQDSVRQLFNRMDDFAENFVAPLIDNVSIRRSEAQEEGKIGPRIKHHLLNIYQELLTNMVKHTFCKEIEVKLSVTGKNMVIEIMNRHEGIKTEQNRDGTQLEHKGRESMEARLREIEASLSWNEPNADIQKVVITALI